MKHLLLISTVLAIFLMVSCAKTNSKSLDTGDVQTNSIEHESEFSDSADIVGESLEVDASVGGIMEDDTVIYLADEPENPLNSIGADDCDIYIIRSSEFFEADSKSFDLTAFSKDHYDYYYNDYLKNFSLSDLSDEILAVKMSDEQKGSFFEYMEYASVDTLPSIDNSIYLGGTVFISYIVVVGEKEYSIAFDYEYIVVDGARYHYDYEYKSDLLSFYYEVYEEDDKVNAVCEVEYRYILGELTDDEYEEEIQELITNDIIGSKEEYSEILLNVDDIKKHVSLDS